VEKEYHVYEKAEAPKDGSYAIDHSNAIYLMGPDGKFVTSYTETMGPEKLADAIMKRM
jgi:protein SCO1/2